MDEPFTYVDRVIDEKHHGAASILVEAFRSEGFTVEWDDAMGRSVQITLS